MVKIIHIFFCAVVILISSGDQQNLKINAGNVWGISRFNRLYWLNIKMSEYPMDQLRPLNPSHIS